MSTIIEYKKIKKTYGDHTIIDDFNLSIEKDEFVTIIGSSGCGKTTILKMINGLITPSDGEVLVHGKNIMQEDMISLRRNIGYVIQESVLFPHLDVERNISYVLDLDKKYQKEEKKAAVKKMLEIVNLDEDVLERYPSELSGGQQQRVGIARALIASPDIILMDEPFGAVDEITRKQLQHEIKRIHQETKVTIVFVTHDINEALTLGTKVLVMDHGVIQQFDTSENIIKHPSTDFVSELVSA